VKLEHVKLEKVNNKLLMLHLTELYGLQYVTSLNSVVE
jgi:hypothetical protein